MKKVLAVLLSMVFVLSAFTGFTYSNAAKSAGKTKLQLWTFVDLHQKFYMSMAEKWNKKNPNNQIELKATTLPYDDMHNKLLIALQSGTGAPDIADIEVSKFPNFLKGTPQLLPLNDIVKPELKNIVKSRVDIYSKGGKYYGICFHIGATVTYYNMDIMKKAGVDPKKIVTWDDFHKYGKIVKTKTGKPMTTFESTDVFQPQLLVSQLGGDMMKNNGTANLDTPELLKALTFMRSMIADGTAIVAPGGYHHAEEYYGFMNKGGSASITMPMWYMSRFTDYMTDLSKKMMILPCPVFKKGEKRSVGLGGTGTTVTNQTKSPNLAKKFIAFCKLSHEGGVEIWNQLGFDPIRTDVWTDPKVRNGKNKFLTYFLDNPFDVLRSIKNEIPGIKFGVGYVDMINKIKTTTFNQTLTSKKDIKSILKADQAALK